MKDSDKQLLKTSAVTGIDAVAGLIPGLSLAWGLSKALYGNGLALRQQKALEWVEMVRDDPSLFKEQVLQSQEFQDGFVVALEDYIKTRSVLKRGMARKIFKEFTRCGNKVEFQLERYDDTLQKISEASIQFLSFLETTIAPLKEETIQKEVEAMDLSKSDKSREWWIQDKRTGRALSKSFDQWLHEEYDPNSPRLKEKYSVDGAIPQQKMEELWDTQKVERARYGEILSELDFLGIIKIGTVDSPGWGGGATSQWRYTRFGEDFIKAISSK